MIQIKNKQTVICTLDESSKIVQDMFAYGLFAHIELEGGGQLLDPTYLHHKEAIPLEYDDVVDIARTLKTWVKDKTYVGTQDEDRLAEVAEQLEDACNRYRGEEFALVHRKLWSVK